VPEGTLPPAVDYLVIGHVCLDETPAGPRLGGTVAYAALAARGQGCRVAVVTSAAPALELAAHLPGIALQRVAAATTTRYRNEYYAGGRRQTLCARAAPLTLADLPPAWRQATIVHLAPVAQELAAEEFVPALRRTTRFLGATPQGWLRGWGADGVVVPQPCADLPRHLAPLDAVVVSEEDLAADPGCAARLAAAGPLVALTRGAAGVRLFQRERVIDLPACPARVRDPTGAGDVFAAVWFIQLAAGVEATAAARYAASAAACAIEHEGLTGVPTAREIEERLAQWGG
jgi:sugar/nucleoside kinase (ribokinase family)